MRDPFRYQADRWPVAALLAVFTVDVAVFLTVDSLPLLAAWTVIGVLPKGCFCAFNHHHQHVATFRSRVLNRVLEQVYALETGVLSNGWVLHHTLGHHRHYLDQSKDESGWRDRHGATMGPLRYTLWNTLVAYPRAWRVGARYPAHRRALIGSGLFIGALLTTLALWRPLPTLFVFGLPMFLSLVGTVYATHAHHAGRSTASHFEASSNIVHRAYNLFTGNLGLHTAHHYRPGVHWSELPALHAELEARIPAHCYRAASLPYTFGDHVTTAALASRQLVRRLARLGRALPSSQPR